MQNALIHHKTEEVNAGISIPNASHDTSNGPFSGHNLGDCLTLAKIQDLIAKDMKLQNLSEACKQELKGNLLASRQLKATGACASNLGAAMDVKVMMARVDLEVGNLFL